MNTTVLNEITGGRDGLRLGLGMAQLSNTDNSINGVKYVPVELACQIITFAIESGIKFFDSGTQYGQTEALLSEVKRNLGVNSMFIATKIGLGSDKIRDFSEKKLNQQIDDSRRRLNSDVIDLLQLNKPSMADLADGRLFSYLRRLKKSGTIRYAGMVVGDVETGYEALNRKSIDTLQVMYNLIYQETEGLIKEASKRNVAVIVRSPLNSGLLSGMYQFNQQFDLNDERNNYFSGDEYKRRLIRIKKIQHDLKIEDCDLLPFSLRFILSNRGVTIAIPGASNLEQLASYIKTGKYFKQFTDDELKEIKYVVTSHKEASNC